MNSIAFSPIAATASTPTPNPRLASAAHEFEASMMQEFLKPLQHDSLFAEDSSQGDDDSGGSANALMSFGAEAMAKAISERGGFGIARKIIEHLQAPGNAVATPHKTPEGHI
jgi:Rod binding domain-containing protein